MRVASLKLNKQNQNLLQTIASMIIAYSRTSRTSLKQVGARPRCSNASPARRSQHLTHSSSAASRTLCSCSPEDAARAHFCYTCRRHQIRGSRQLATYWGSSSGLSSHLICQTGLRHPIRPSPPHVPAHELTAAQRVESSGGESSDLP
jgi:hypothetical protein